MTEQMMYLLIRRGLYVRPDGQSCTGIKAEAGRFTTPDVMTFINDDDDELDMVAEALAPEYSPECPADLRLIHANAGLLNAQGALPGGDAEWHSTKTAIDSAFVDLNEAAVERAAARSYFYEAMRKEIDVIGWEQENEDIRERWRESVRVVVRSYLKTVRTAA